MRSLLSRIFKPSLLLASAMALVGLQGCSAIYKTTGDILVHFGQDELLPYMLTYNDVRMGCITGEAQTPLLMSFRKAGANPERLGVMTFTTAAVCAQNFSQRANLRYLRAIRAGEVSEAQDARIVQKRWAELAAQRLLKAYELTIYEYGPLEGDQCPRLRTDMDQMVWLVGNISGLNALVFDTTAGGIVGVPRDIVAKVEHNMTCLNNEKWWGAPMGVRATIWTLLPQLAPAGAKPWQTLEQSVQLGFEQGVRLSSALYAVSAYGKGDTQRLRQAIRDFATHDQNLDPAYTMIDSIAGVIVRDLSDNLWTKNTGKRTPMGELGSFWDDKPANQTNIDIDDLL